MIRKLSLQEIVDAAKTLRVAEQAALFEALRKQLATSGVESPRPAAPPASPQLATDWTVLATEGLSRAYGESEPDYSEKDLVP